MRELGNGGRARSSTFPSYIPAKATLRRGEGPSSDHEVGNLMPPMASVRMPELVREREMSHIASWAYVRGTGHCHDLFCCCLRAIRRCIKLQSQCVGNAP